MKKTNIILTILLVGLMVGACAPKITPPGKSPETQGDLKKFSSEEELKEFLETDQGYHGGVYMARAEMAMDVDVAEEAIAAPTASLQKGGGEGASDFSTTNIQVKGVDEADIVKNDGKYIYVLANNILSILDAYPAEDAELLSEIKLNGNPREMFINGDKLIVFGNDYKREKSDDETFAAEIARIAPIPFPRYQRQYAYAKIYDISDKDNPDLEEEIIIRGYYFNSRMIGDHVYMITNEYARYYEDIPTPCIYTLRDDKIVDQRCIPALDIFYFDYPDSYEFSTIMAIDLDDNSHKEETILKGTSQVMFVSQDNIYITFQKRMPYYHRQMRIIEEVFIPELPSDKKTEIERIKSYDISEQSKLNEMERIIEKWLYSMSQDEQEKLEKYLQDKIQNIERQIQKELEQTTIQKISIHGMDIDPKESGQVPGRPLNQFSMDEYDQNFRIATTVSGWNRDASANNVYVLDEDMDVIGELEDLAPGERIYSARFMGERLYLVTFRNIDPLFVIDLSDPKNPDVLGKLKIPGYSDYLHPYDEDHIIGIGKETVEDKERDIAWQQGVKLALFDVSDVTKPKEIDKVEIGDRGTDSYALRDHKAFLFSKDKELLVIPVRVAEIDEDKYPNGVDRWQYGETTFVGAYVFNLNLEDGFQLQGKISHVEDDDKYKKAGHYWFGRGEDIKRSLYMDDTLYTISDAKVQMHDLDDLDEINEVELPYEEEVYKVGVPEPFVGDVVVVRGGPE